MMLQVGEMMLISLRLPRNEFSHQNPIIEVYKKAARTEGPFCSGPYETAKILKKRGQGYGFYGQIVQRRG